jgi:ribosomal-protein-alanine N-acetyltransferase
MEAVSDTRIWCMTEKGKDSLIGICGFLKNDENEEELAYRFIEKYWGNGLGTEIASALIDYGFNMFKTDKITADVYVMNSKSEKILVKFMSPVKEFYNRKDNCTDRRYELTREIWLQKQIELKQ